MKKRNVQSLLLSCLSAAFIAGCGGGSDGNPPTTGCTPGTSNGCAAGQICSASGVCETQGTNAGNLVIDSAAARACEVLLESSSTTIEAVTFGTGVQGVLRARPPRFAIAVKQDGNQNFAQDALTLQLTGSADAVTIRQLNCFGADGSPVVASAAIQ
ncbi:MAG: hypothetical protein AAFV29_00430 [Myxococcota bacterium]